MDQTIQGPTRGHRVVAVLIVLCVLTIAGAARAAATRPHAIADWRCVLVRPGDTLWSVAKEVSGDDPRRVVTRIAERNDVDDGLITPGMELWVPSEDPRYRAQTSECGPEVDAVQAE